LNLFGNFEQADSIFETASISVSQIICSLEKLQEEDPTFRVRTDEETLDVIISGMGELHFRSIS